MELQAQIRDPKIPAKQLLVAGQIPAELYGRKIDNTHLLVSAKDFKKLFKQAGRSAVVSLHIDGKKHSALVYDVQRHPITSEIAHVDFYHVEAGQKVTAKIPVEFVGESPAVKLGGVLNAAVSEIEVEAAADLLPRNIEIDLSLLDQIGKAVCVKDLKLNPNIKVISDQEMTIVSVTAPRAEEDLSTPSEVDLSTVKVESEEKKAERDAKKLATSEE